MTLQEAICSLASIQKQLVPGATQEELDALNIGAEGLKRLQCLRQHPRLSLIGPLPGETEE